MRLFRFSRGAERVERLADLGCDGTRTFILTDAGKEFAAADLEAEKAIFRKRVVAQVSLLQFIIRELEANPGHVLGAEPIVDHLESGFSDEEARRQIDIAVECGRYAGLFSYDGNARLVRLDEEHPRRARADLRPGLTRSLMTGFSRFLSLYAGLAATTCGGVFAPAVPPPVVAR